jgi:hypothetical protein
MRFFELVNDVVAFSVIVQLLLEFFDPLFETFFGV